jgi:hypothetical protein
MIAHYPLLLDYPETRAKSRARTLHNLPKNDRPGHALNVGVWFARRKSPRSFDEL